MKYEFPEEIVLPGGQVLKPVHGRHLDNKPFLDEKVPLTMDNIKQVAKRRGLKYRVVYALCRNLRGKLDLHHRPYEEMARRCPWIYVEVKP